jgi:site-specific DNA-methyltransferase (adenine-specific)
MGSVQSGNCYSDPHGELLGLKKNRLYQGDCVELLQQLDPESIDLVFADPPFNIGYRYDVYNDRKQADDYLTWCRGWMQGIYRCLKSDGTFWLAIGDEFAAELKIAAQDCGFSCRSWVIWYYTFGVNCRRGFSRSHTHLFHFVRDPASFTFNAENPRVRVPSARQLVYADARANPRGRLPDNTWIFRPQDAAGSFAADHDTWYFARVAGTFRERQGFHGCQMPEQLLGRIIRTSSHPQETVLDPFGGSGTTLAVARKLGRQWIGFELSEEYVRYIRQRLASIQVGDDLDGPTDPLTSAPQTARGRKRPGLRHRGRRKADSRAAHQFDEGLGDAFREASQGYSVDHLLCDPDLVRQFLDGCRERQLPGDATHWNHSLLRLRKAGRLPAVTREKRRLTFQSMDPFSYASEIAMRLLSVDYGLTLDEALCNPGYAARLDRLAAQFAPGYSPADYRWAALAIRKRARQSRVLGRKQFAEWLTCKLPSRTPLSRIRDGHLDQPGVYILWSGSRPLYVGESAFLYQRLAAKRDNPAWQELSPTSATLIPDIDKSRSGLQSVLIQRTRATLNWPILKARIEDPAALATSVS